MSLVDRMRSLPANVQDDVQLQILQLIIAAKKQPSNPSTQKDLIQTSSNPEAVTYFLTKDMRVGIHC